MKAREQTNTSCELRRWGDILLHSDIAPSDLPAVQSSQNDPLLSSSSIIFESRQEHRCQSSQYKDGR